MVKSVGINTSKFPPRNKAKDLVHEAIIYMKPSNGTNKFLERNAFTRDGKGHYCAINKNGDVSYFYDHSTPAVFIPEIPNKHGNKLSVKA